MAQRITLLSDTHGDIPEDVLEHLKTADEIWHAGDIGSQPDIEILESLNKPLRMVWGNIDPRELRLICPEHQVFECEGVKVAMTHIGGYPGRYSKQAKQLIVNEKPGLFICGHSHILRVMHDKINQLLYMNPGAAGYKGFHKFRTLLKFEIHNGKVENLNAVDFGPRGLGSIA